MPRSVHIGKGRPGRDIARSVLPVRKSALSRQHLICTAPPLRVNARTTAAGFDEIIGCRTGTARGFSVWDFTGSGGRDRAMGQRGTQARVVSGVELP